MTNTMHAVGSSQPIYLRTAHPNSSVPTRVSVERGDPAYLPAPCFGQPDPVVYLNGARQQLVVTADSDKGILRRYKLANGRAIPNGDSFEIEELTGHVEIKMD